MAAGEGGDVEEDGFAVVAEGGGFHAADLEVAAQAVYDEGGEDLAVDVLGDYQQGLLLFVGVLNKW